MGDLIDYSKLVETLVGGYNPKTGKWETAEEKKKRELSEKRKKTLGNFADKLASVFPSGISESESNSTSIKEQIKEEVKNDLNLFTEDNTLSPLLSKSSVLSNEALNTLLSDRTLIDLQYNPDQYLNNAFDQAASKYQSDLNAKAEAKAEKQEKLAKGFGIAGAASDLVNSFLPEKREYSGKHGAITAGMDEAYDQLADVASKFGPVGSIVGGAMKANAALGKIANLTGAGTDAMTVQDAILGSSFLGPVGWVNGWGGKTTSTITKDNEAFAQVGSSYGGTENTVDEALEVSGKKYGLLSNSARKKAERQLAEARRQQNIIQGISEDALIRSTLQGTMSDILSNRYGLLLQGGYNLGAIHVGRKGLKVSPYKARRLVSNVTFYQKGGPVTKDRTLEELIEYAKKLNPRFIQRLMEKPTQWVETPDGRPGTHLLSYSNNKDGWYVWPLIQEINGQLTYIPNLKDAMDKALQDGDYLKFNSEKEAKDFSENYKKGFPEFFEEFEKLTSNKVEKDEQGTKIASYIEPVDFNYIITTFKEGGIIPSKVETIIEPALIITEIVPLELELIESFLNGGEINIIPDGALHKNLHHMEDAENLTKKGIPVVTTNDGELVAEIERGEIVLRLEVTEKLEELCELYYSEDATKKEKDEYALEAGLMLVDEILNNTIDNTNKLL